MKKIRKTKRSGRMLKVLLAEDETLFRDVIKDLLKTEKDIQVVGEANDGHEAVRMAKALKPDVILMDINLPLLNGVGATKIIHGDCPNIKVLMLSGYQDEIHVMESVQAGAYGYLSKKLPGAELVKALKTFAEQGTLIPPPIMQSVLSRLHHVNQLGDTSLGSLTKTQMRVLALLGEGKSNKDISAELGCNVKTVKNHLNILFQKFDVKNRTEAVVKGIKAGFITGKDPLR